MRSEWGKLLSRNRIKFMIPARMVRGEYIRLAHGLSLVKMISTYSIMTSTSHPIL